jgi:hypothetical protein
MLGGPARSPQGPWPGRMDGAPTGLTNHPRVGSQAKTVPEARARGIRRGEFVVAAALLAQYVLGLVLKLFVTVPDQAPHSRPASAKGTDRRSRHAALQYGILRGQKSTAMA